MIELLIFLSVLLTTMGQLLLKYAALQNKFINWYLLLGYTLFFIVIILSYLLMYLIEFKIFTIIMTLNYLTVFFTSIIIFKEKINKHKVTGVFTIVLGIIIFTWN